MALGKKVYIWRGSTIDGEEKTGLIESITKRGAEQDLRDQNFYQLRISRVLPKTLNSQLPNDECVELISSIILLLNAGIPFLASLDWLLKEQRPVSQQYVLCRLMQSLQEGHSLSASFSHLGKQFTPFFLTMIDIAEQSDRILEGLQSLLISLKQKEQRRKELKKLLSYPKVVMLTTLLMTLGVIGLIIPMFKNIYLLFEDDLPIFTKLFLFLSDGLHQNLVETAVVAGFLISWPFLPLLREFNPLLHLKKRFTQWTQSAEDLFLYSQAVYKMLESGIPLKFTMERSALCLSPKNLVFGHEISSKLDAGFSLSRAFSESRWFPRVFHRIIASSEKAGHLAKGFHHICIYLEQKREESFQRWQKLIEPCMMLFLGGLVLMILLAVYLPIFDLGNRLG